MACTSTNSFVLLFLVSVPSAPERPMPMTDNGDPALLSFDRLMTAFLDAHEVPGAALAVTKGGRLVLARGYGWADLETKDRVEPGSLFRIASLSKPITAVTVLRLVEEGRLSLASRALDVLEESPLPGHAGPANGNLAALPAPADPRFRDITILHLLQHTAGFDRDRSFDPMFRSVEIARALEVEPPARPEHVIRYMLGQRLDFAPGDRFAYSNFGYCLLGRVIEKVSGKNYESHVREDVLAPLGIRRPRSGRSLKEGRAPGEVAYHAKGDATGPAVMGAVGIPVPWQYGGWCLESMDAHGGWIASAVDLARFAAALDSSARSRILSPRSLEVLFARPAGRAGHEENGSPSPAFYACGWMVRPTPGDGRANEWHTGGFDGTSTLLVRRHDGVGWVVLFNARSGKDGRDLSRIIDPLLHEAANAVERWPEGDLFERYR